MYLSISTEVTKKYLSTLVLKYLGSLHSPTATVFPSNGPKMVQRLTPMTTRFRSHTAGTAWV